MFAHVSMHTNARTYTYMPKHVYARLHLPNCACEPPANLFAHCNEHAASGVLGPDDLYTGAHPRRQHMHVEKHHHHHHHHHHGDEAGKRGRRRKKVQRNDEECKPGSSAYFKQLYQRVCSQVRRCFQGMHAFSLNRGWTGTEWCWVRVVHATDILLHWL